MARERIAIIGAGIGGLAAALALARRQFDVILVERSPRPEPTGAGIQLSPNAMRVLDDFGLRNLLAPHLVEPDAILVRDARDGATIVRMPLGDAAERWGARYGVIHRADLQQVLLEAVEAEALITVAFGTRFVGLREAGGGLVVTVERGGSPEAIEADIAIGADGLWSSVAVAVGRLQPPIFAQRRAWRAIIPLSGRPAMQHDPVATLWLGAGAHLVHYPIRGGEALNVVAVLSDERDAGGWSERGKGAEVAEKFAGWPRDLVAMMAAHTDWLGWPLYHRTDPGPFSVGRVALLGDAAHPMLPFLAQGGAMAIEDAAVLAACLAGRGCAPDRLAAYAAARSERVARVAREARANAGRYHWDRPFSTARNIAMRLSGGRALLDRYDWLYGWRPPAT